MIYLLTATTPHPIPLLLPHFFNMLPTTTPPPTEAGGKTNTSYAIASFNDPLVPSTAPLPTPLPGQVLVHLRTSSICHTDLHVASGDWAVKATLPRVPGHEGAGVVAALGEGVHCLKVGDRVGLAWLASSCNTCPSCLSGWETLCPSIKCTGFTVDGCFSQYVIARADYVIPLPPALSFAQASPLLCAGVTTWKAIKVSGCRGGQWLAVLGACGGLGSLAVKLGAALGMQVLALDLAEENREHALRALGAAAYVSTQGKAAAEVAAEARALCSGGLGAHAALILAPAPAAYALGMALLAPGGTAVGVSLPAGAATLDVLDMVLQGKCLKGSIVGTRQDLAEVLDFCALKGISVGVQERPLEQVNEAMAELKAGKVVGRIVLSVCRGGWGEGGAALGTGAHSTHSHTHTHAHNTCSSGASPQTPRGGPTPPTNSPSLKNSL